MTAVISATGLWTPQDTISNEELVATFNQYVEQWNLENKDAIVKGELNAIDYSSAEFIEKASGIKSRHVISKEAILDPDIMAPRYPERADEEPSILAEISVKAAQNALEKAGRDPKDVDAVIISCSTLPRSYPALAIEVQKLLGISGFAFDMNVACSSAPFGVEIARGLMLGGQARSVLVISPEICTAWANFRDRTSHFLFGDVAAAILIEDKEIAPSDHWEIIGTKLETDFSNNIRNNFGFLNPCETDEDLRNTEDYKYSRKYLLSRYGLTDKLFVQNGRRVFKEIVPFVAKTIKNECEKYDISTDQLKRMWLHQANLNMNSLIAKKVMGKEVNMDRSPMVINDHGNTSSAGSVVAFHKYSDDFNHGDVGILCAFGAGYSIGSLCLKRIKSATS